MQTNKTETNETLYRVLIVDDDAPVREVLAALLRAPNRSIEMRDSARAALEFLQHDPIDLAFVDAKMPGMTGAEFVKKQSIDVAVLCDLPEVDHHRQSHGISRLDRAIDRSPARTSVMRGLEAHDEIPILLGGPGGVFGIHLRGIVFPTGMHPGGHDVQERQNACACMLNDVVAEIRKIPPAG